MKIIFHMLVHYYSYVMNAEVEEHGSHRYDGLLALC